MEREIEREEVLDGIWRIGLPTPYPVGNVNIYLLAGTSSFDIVDAGPPSKDSLRELRNALSEFELDLSGPDNIFLTHGHIDHAGLAPALMSLSNPRIFMGRPDIPIIETTVKEVFLSKKDGILRYFRGMGFPDDVMQQLPHHFASWDGYSVVPGSVSPLMGGERLHSGRFDLEVIPVPGHSMGSVCYYLRELGAVFSGDTLLDGITPNPGSPIYTDIVFRQKITSNPLKHFLESLKHIRDLGVSLALPGHGKTIANPAGIIDGYLRHHELRLERIVKLTEAGSCTCHELASMMFGRCDGIDDLVLQTIEVLAHLVYLENDGRIRRVVSEDRVVRYAAIQGIRPRSF